MNEKKNIEQDESLLIKKLTYRSSYRGCKETDLILGFFAKNYLKHLCKEDINLYSDLLEEDEGLLYQAFVLSKTEEINIKYKDLIQMIMSYYQQKD